jgi:hypothetical protein
VWNIISRVNRVETPRPPLSPETSATLRKHFARDVELLGQLLGRGPFGWLAVNSLGGPRLA